MRSTDWQPTDATSPMIFYSGVILVAIEGISGLEAITEAWLEQ
jgi:hypothetical protein